MSRRVRHTLQDFVHFVSTQRPPVREMRVSAERQGPHIYIQYILSRTRGIERRGSGGLSPGLNVMHLSSSCLARAQISGGVVAPCFIK